MRIFSFTNGKVFIGKDLPSVFRSFDKKIPDNSCSFEGRIAEMIRHTFPKLPEHNVQNATMAIQCASATTSIDIETLIPSIGAFQNLPHRYEQHQLPNGQVFVNDSKATNLDATLTALKTTDGPLTLLLGGQGKGESFQGVNSFKDKIHQVILFGEMGHDLAKQLTDLKVKKFATLAETMDHIEDWYANNCVLFAPGGASFDEFRNFNARGDYFVQTILTKLGG